MIDVVLGLHLARDKLRRYAGRLVNKLALWLVRRESDPCVVLPDSVLFRFREDCQTFQELAWVRDKDSLFEFTAALMQRRTATVWKGPAIAYFSEKENPGSTPLGPKRIRLEDYPIEQWWSPANQLVFKKEIAA